MTAKDHNRMLGIFFAIHAAMQGLGILIITIVYGGLGIAMMTSRRSQEQTMGIFFIVMMIFIFIFGLIVLIPQIFAAFKTLKNKAGARFWAIFAAIVSLFSFPFGTALGVYALWFLFSEQGKAFYASGGGSNPMNNFSPPQPNSWQ